jgi:hypothetical protein
VVTVVRVGSEEWFVPDALQIFKFGMKRGKTEYSTKIICKYDLFDWSIKAVILLTEGL